MTEKKYGIHKASIKLELAQAENPTQALNAHYEGCSIRERSVLDGIVRELKECGYINVHWADDMPWIVTLNNSARTYSEQLAEHEAPKAANQPDKDFFFIIDEINRGNMSKIFGELLMLIERDYRGTKATLAYNGMTFSVPKNLYIIGMMNTADRSLAMIDYVLRRRFSFFDIESGFASEGFMKYQQNLDNETFSLLVTKVQELNKEISMDKSLGKGFCIGHSYFCGQTECTEEWMQAIVDYEILPMLNEYWFDDLNKLQRWENILRGVFQ